jgi:transposase
MWDIYNAIREIESSFRCLKTDLDLRPNFHKTDSAVMAHRNLGLLAYQIVSTIRHQLKAKNIHSDWRNIVRTMNSQKCITTSMTNSKEQVICIRKCSEPEADVKKIYDALNYKYAPFIRKKSVVPP